MGNHPHHNNVFIFNGLGTKGVSLAPYFAKEMLSFLETNKVLLPEANIERFYSLYSL
jgi:glycine/D-amino acid oxidase-like deaminating enzyme